MQEFENVAYLDLQKTGSSTIKTVLRDLLDEEQLDRRSHKAPREDFDRSKLCFISVREPLSLYISLFTFAALKRNGNLYGRLCRKGLERLYEPSLDGFEHWLAFILDPKNANFLKRDYAKIAPCEAIGLLSYRLLYVSVPQALEKMRKDKFRDPDGLRKLFQRRLYGDHVRTENLAGDLFAFLLRSSGRIRLRAPLTTEAAFGANLPVRNPSGRISGLARENVSPALQRRVREREWLFYEAFGYDADPKGRPPSS